MASSNFRGLYFGVGTPLYKRCWYVSPQWVWFLLRFGLKTGIDFVYFGPESRVWFARKLRECETYLPFQYQMRKKLKKKFANSKWILKETFFGWSSNLCNDDIIS